MLNMLSIEPEMYRRSIGELIDPISMQNPAISAPNNLFTYIDLSAIDQIRKVITGARMILGQEAPSRARQVIHSGDVLISTVRPNLNGVALVTDKYDGAIASTGFCVLRSRGKYLDPSFLFHWVRTQSFIESMKHQATGASYPAVTDRIVRDSLIPAPPITEQRRIAAILDQADALRAKRRAALAQLDEMAQAIFVEMFGDPIQNEKNFAQEPLASVIDPSRPITYGILMPGPHDPDGINYVRVIDINNGMINIGTVRKTSPDIDRQHKRSKLKSGDLLISIRGYVGRTAITPLELDEANITQDTARLAIINAEPLFMQSLLQTPSIIDWMASRTRGAAVRGINLGDLKILPVIQPPLQYQEVYAEIIRKIHSLKENAERQAEHIKSFSASLQNLAFAGGL